MTAVSIASVQFQQALRFYQQGNFLEAERILREILRSDPRNPAALHSLGVIAYQQNNYAQAEALFGSALIAQPENMEALCLRANALLGLNRLDEAVASYDRALALKADIAPALFNRGNALFALNRLDEAVSSFAKAVAINPGDALIHFRLGLALQCQGKLNEARRHYGDALAVKPDYADAYSNLGSLLEAMGDPAAAISHFERAIALDPNNAVYRHNLGLVLHRCSRLSEALERYEQALRIEPQYPEALNSHGTALVALGRPDEGFASYLKALKLKPNDPALHFNAGVALHRCGQPEGALAYYDQALTLKPDYVEALSNRGSALLDIDRLEEALSSSDRALELRPQHAEALNNRGNVLRELRRLDEALASFGKALAVQPDLPEAHWNQSVCWLMEGEFQKGFQEFEWRWRTAAGAGLKRSFPQPLWLGDRDISGKTILLHAEQGFGDAIQFCRYAAQVAQRGARVVVEVPSVLTSLLGTLEGVAEIHASGDPLPAFDVHCPFMSLPLAVKTTVATIPADVPYLRAAPAAVAKWQAALQETRRPRIGLAWRSSLHQKNYRHKSIAPGRLTPLLACDATFISLQKDYLPEDDQWLVTHPEIRRFGDDLADFSDTAALASVMDVIITVDTAVAHLAGALGLPVWILLPHIGIDWRWMLDRSDCPWYPTARLYRQPAIGDWGTVIDRVAQDLRALRIVG